MSASKLKRHHGTLALVSGLAAHWASPVLADPPSDLIWSGATGAEHPLYADPANWWSADTLDPATSSPTSSVRIIFDNRHAPNAPFEGSWSDNGLLVGIPRDTTVEASSLRVANRGFELYAGDAGSIGGTLRIHGPITVDDGALLYIDDNISIDLTHGGEDGDLVIGPAPGSIGGLRCQKCSLTGDEFVIAEADSSDLGQFTGPSIGNGSIAQFRRVEVADPVGRPSDFIRGGLDLGSSQLIATEMVTVTGALNVFLSAINTPLLSIEAGGFAQLSGRYDESGAPVTSFDVSPGLVGDLTNAGTIEISYVTTNYYRVIGAYSIDGDFRQTDGGVLNVDINGTRRFPTWDRDDLARHDSLSITGNADLGGTLVIEPGPDLELQPGDEFLVLEVGGEVTGEFSGLSEGSVAYTDAATATDLRISYKSGDGNDVGFYATMSVDPACPVDLAPPSGSLESGDVLEFLSAFSCGDPRADFAAPLGEFNVDDLLVYLVQFDQGCE